MIVLQFFYSVSWFWPQSGLLISPFQGLLQYQINNPNLKWSHMFGVLEENVVDLGIVDYSLSQTSLEQVIQSGNFSACGLSQGLPKYSFI